MGFGAERHHNPPEKEPSILRKQHINLQNQAKESEVSERNFFTFQFPVVISPDLQKH